VNFYKHHIGDYAQATGHLTWVEDMAYTRLMRLYYSTEKPIPVDVAQACRLVRATSKVERQAVEQVLREFFVLEADGWHQKRCDAEIDAFAKKANSNRENGKKGGRPRKEETDSDSEHEPTNNPDGFCLKPTENLNQIPDKNPPTPLAAASGEKRRRRKPKTPCPEAMEITDEMYDWANGKGLQDERVVNETERFLAWHQGKDSQWSDWKRAWQTWMLKAVSPGLR